MRHLGGPALAQQHPHLHPSTPGLAVTTPSIPYSDAVEAEAQGETSGTGSQDQVNQWLGTGFQDDINQWLKDLEESGGPL